MKTIYLSSENKATLVCPQCEKAKVIDASKYLQKEGPIKIKFTFKCRHCYCGDEHADDCDGTDCKQGNTIAALLERRRYYRKNVNYFLALVKDAKFFRCRYPETLWG